jgi:hypothetical protein
MEDTQPVLPAMHALISLASLVSKSPHNFWDPLPCSFDLLAWADIHTTSATPQLLLEPGHISLLVWIRVSERARTEISGTCGIVFAAWSV